MAHDQKRAFLDIGIRSSLALFFLGIAADVTFPIPQVIFFLLKKLQPSGKEFQVFYVSVKRHYLTSRVFFINDGLRQLHPQSSQTCLAHSEFSPFLLQKCPQSGQRSKICSLVAMVIY